MTHNALPEFQALAEQTSLPLPPLLAQLLASGQTHYGPDWASTWRERSLQGSPAFISWDDFEWQRAEDARTTISDWLNPADQAGRRFLPFGESGAGDAFCLTPLDDGRLAWPWSGTTMRRARSNGPRSTTLSPRSFWKPWLACSWASSARKKPCSR